MDLAIANYGTNNVGILLGTSNSTFANQITFSTGPNSHPYSLAVGHLNDDAKLDIAIANYGNNSVGVLLGHGNGAFMSQMTYSLSAASPYSIGIGDFNNDNRMDLVVTNNGTNNTALLVGYGNGTFASPKMYSTGSSSSISIAIGDLNRDNRLDIVIINNDTSTISIMLGYDEFFPIQRTYSTSSVPYSVAVGNFNNNTRLDIVVAIYGDNTISVLLGYANGTFANQTKYSTGSAPISTAVGDFNNDTHLDIVIANLYGYTVSVFLGYGNGSFANQMKYSTGSQPLSAAVGDFNNDTHLDIVVANSDDNTISVLLGYGNGSFANQTTYSTGSLPSSAAVGNFNNDIHLDIVVANWGDKTISVLLGYGNGSFVNQMKHSTGHQPWSVAVGDFNNNTRLDIVVANAGDNTVSVFLGYGNGSFANQTTYSTGSKPESVAVVDVCKQLKKQSVHSSILINAAGFTYTGIDDTARCLICGLEVSEWTAHMNPFTVHVQQSPNCSFVQSIVSKNRMNFSSSDGSITENQNFELSQHKKIDQKIDYCLIEVEIMKEIRCRTFSHWPHQNVLSRTQMTSAGFFYCNVGDRVICLYCNLICQQWTPHTDDPEEVHQTLSPLCPYVLFLLKTHQTSTVSILNDRTNNRAVTSNLLRFNEIVQASASHRAYIEISKRQTSFNSWPQEELPSVDDLVRAGFFYTGSKTIVTCFYCNGSLQNWGPKDNPLIEHVRWFPLCAYAKQLCDDELYRKVQESKRIHQERTRTNQIEKNGNFSNDHSTNNSQLVIPDENTLSRFVAARLDLPISQSLLNQNFKLSVIKRCWEDQLRLKQNDFTTDCDLLIACIILQKQIDHINGRQENIIIPSIKMKIIREKEQSGSSLSSTPPMNKSSSSNSSNINNTVESKSTIATTDNQSKTSSTTDIVSSNLCILCLTEDKRLACMPCGHLATCVPCGHSLRTCPVCRKEIEAFVRIYI
ncbi:unnamed protein product [Rotaria sordida]|uniref:RING-type domain-containing protein n=1 Tax=Rotaria sordida TaxID=392033 RepID=A0A815W7Q4_9BILA|nr:unnamed protein product [Rotaria sordida]CAF1540231.1 unnamed protein product [Rotaria sordida]